MAKLTKRRSTSCFEMMSAVSTPVLRPVEGPGTYRSSGALSLIAFLFAILALTACSGSDFNETEKATIASLSLLSLKPLPADPTNRFADQPGPAAFGATLFFEQRLSRDGNVSCSTCHMIDRQFQDDRPFGLAVGETKRRTMPLADV